MPKKLFLLDGMALIYRAHFALIRNPIFNSAGQNTSALFGFTNTLLEILTHREPTHIAIALDTPEPTERHALYEPYKAHREEMPEDIAFSLPHIERFARAFRIPVLKYPGYEADDVIGTAARAAEEQGFETYMVTPDKDFAQLVTTRTFLCRPARQGGEMEVLSEDDVKEKWNVASPEQVADVLGLMGDSSDNIPGVPGYGEKTAKKLIGTYGTVENLIDHIDDLKGKQKERLEDHKEQALLSKRLAIINRHVPITEEVDALAVAEPDRDALEGLLVEFEFNTLGRRLLGDDFRAGRGHAAKADSETEQDDLFGADLTTIDQVGHAYRLVSTSPDRAALANLLREQRSFCFDVETDGLDPKQAQLVGIAFSFAAHEACFMPCPEAREEIPGMLEEFADLFASESIEKVGHHLKFDISILKWHGMAVRGPLFDTMLAHVLVEPDRRHTMDALAEQYLGYSPVPLSALIGDRKEEQRNIRDVDPKQLADYAAEDADVTWQLRGVLAPLLKEKGQERVFYEVECPLVPVLVDMEYEGVTLDLEALATSSRELATSIGELQTRIHELAGTDFNLNSPKQLGEILFDKLQLVEKPKKTKTGQYSTNEQVLAGLAAKHEIVSRILEYRESAKLKNTYVDALPDAVFPGTGRVHTSYHQAGAATGRLASSDPNLQNIPIRTPQGRQIRKAFVARNEHFGLLSADYSQVELRVMAEMSGDRGLREAFLAGHDIHAATAAGVFGCELDEVDPEMRRTAKMVNFGIIFGISAFGLAQRLGVPRHEAAAIIEQYFVEFPQVRVFMDQTIASCREKGYVETLTGRRRYVRDINSANGTTRAGAERTAINSPIQGTAADLIKIAMRQIHSELEQGDFKTRMILQVHDELVFDMRLDEEAAVRPLIERCMTSAIPMSIPLAVEMGSGRNWLEAH